MQPRGIDWAFLGEAFSKDAPLFNVAIGNTDDNWHAELHGVGERITQPSTLGLELAEFVEDHNFWSVFERRGEQGGGFRQCAPIQSATSCFLSAIFRKLQDDFRGEFLNLHVALGPVADEFVVLNDTRHGDTRVTDPVTEIRNELISREAV